MYKINMQNLNSQGMITFITSTLNTTRKYLLLFSRLLFHLAGGFLCCAKAFKFDIFLIVYFCFCGP